MLAHVHGDQQVAAAGRAGRALAAGTDLLAVADALRDLHLDRLAVRAAQGHRGALDRAAEGDRGGGGAVRALRGARPRVAGVTEAAGAEAAGLAGGAAEHPAEQVRQVGPGLRGAGAAPAAEHAAEDVLEAAAAGTARGGEPGAAAHRADRVVLLALLGVAQDGVRLRDLLELLLGRLVPGVLVRVVGAGELAVGLLHVRIGGVLGHPQGRVEVLVHPILRGHGASSRVHRSGGRPAAGWAAGRRGHSSPAETITWAARSTRPSRT